MEISPLDGKMSQQAYGIKVATILHGTEQVSSELEYLAALIEQPDPEFQIEDALVYAVAVVALSNQLEFLVEDVATSDLNEDETYVKLTKGQLLALNRYNAQSEEALQALEEVCGISLKNN